VLQPKRRLLFSHGVAFCLAASVSGVLWFVGAADSLDHWLYDRCQSTAIFRQQQPTPVLLVSASAETLASQEQRKQLVSQIDRLGARGIAFTTPHAAGNSPEADARTSAWVIAPDRFFDSRSRPDRISGVRATRQTRELVLVGFPYQSDGVQRSQCLAFPLGNGSAPSLEAKIAGGWFSGGWTAPQRTFLINYNCCGAALPTVPASAVLDEGLAAELVRDRVVLIGRERDVADPGLRVPLLHERPMTPLEVHGHAVNSLLTQTWIPVPPMTQTLALVVLGSLAVYILGQYFHRRHRPLVIALLAMELLAGWAVLCFGNVWFPVGWLWCAQLCTALTCSTQGRWRLHDFVDRAACHTRTRLQLCESATESGAGLLSALAGEGGLTAAAERDDSSAELSRGLDSLHFLTTLLESVFDRAGTGFALYDANGTLLRINRSFSASLAGRTCRNANSPMNEIRDAVKQVLETESPASLTLAGNQQTGNRRVDVRPIEFRWSSPLAPVDTAEIFKTQFVLCECRMSDERLAVAETGLLRSGELAETPISGEPELAGAVFEQLSAVTQVRYEDLFSDETGNSDRPDPPPPPQPSDSPREVAEPVYE